MGYKVNRDIVIQADAISLVSSTLRDHGINGKILYVSDSVIDELLGEIVREQIASIGKIKIEIVELNTISYSMIIAERCVATDIDCIVGLGGGKVLDVCKYAAHLANVPFLSIPTTAANDGIASPIAVLKRQDDLPKSLGCTAPDMLLVDTNIILKAPVQLIKAGIGDTISNYTALLDWDLAVKRGKDRMNGYARLMSQTSLDALLRTKYDAIDEHFIGVLVDCLVLSGVAMEFAGSSRPVSGSEHLFSHALDYYSPVKNLHGLQVALGTVAILRLIGKDDSMIVRYLKRFDVDVNPVHLGIDRDVFVACMQKATSMRKNRYTCLEELDLTDSKLSKVYEDLLEVL